jgi:chemotaxis methyl-accepting protein methylase
MDRVTLTDAIKAGPVKEYMNDGSRFVIASSEFAIVDDRAVHVLTTEPGGKMRTRIFALGCMTGMEPISADGRVR